MIDLLILLMLPGVVLLAIGLRYGFEEVAERWPWWLISAGMAMIFLAGWADG